MKDTGRSMRRKLLIAIGAALLAETKVMLAQQPPAKVSRIGFLGLTSAAGVKGRMDGLRAGLRELGYVEGRNLVIESRWAEGRYERLPALAAELVRLKVDAIVTYSTPGTLAAKQATSAIPIVMATVGEAVATGLVPNLARPGGNVTGVSFFGAEINAKRLELIQEASPRIRRVGVVFNPDNAAAKRELEVMEVTAGKLKLELEPLPSRSPAQFEGTFEVMGKLRVDAVTINEDPMLVANAGSLGGLAARHRIASIGFVELVDAGGLMAYGANFPAMWHRAAFFVDRILKGADPGTLAIEQPTKFDLVINLKAAGMLGIRIPQSLVLRADRVID
jgi:putative ABC transport system substrate-binding protein